MKLILLDWNGTTIDDMPIWYKSIKKIFELYKVNPPSIEDYFKMLESAKSYTEVYNSLGINLSQEELDRIYQEEYQKHLQDIKLSPGVKKVLDILIDKKVVPGIITPQLQPLFDPVFLRLGLKKYFKYVIIEAQKKSTLILHLCVLEKIKPENCYYVGDSPSDIRAAKKARVNSVAYLDKYIPEELISATCPDFTISHFQELIKLIEKRRGS